MIYNSLILKIKSGFYSKGQRGYCGFILLEVIISIVLFGFIVLGSIYSYSFVHQRILRQHQHRAALALLQGWMEQTRSYLINIAAEQDPNILMSPNSNFLNQAQDRLKTNIRNSQQMQGIFSVDSNTVFDISISKSGNNKFIDINISATLNNLPIRLYTQISPYVYKPIMVR